MQLFYHQVAFNVQRCQERLAENRHSFLEKFRHKDIAFNDEEAREAIHNLVLNEWKSFEKDMKESTLQNPDSVCEISCSCQKCETRNAPISLRYNF